MQPVEFTRTIKTLAKLPSIISAIIAKVAMTRKKLIASEQIVFKRVKTKFSSRVRGCDLCEHTDSCALRLQSVRIMLCLNTMAHV